MSEWKKLKAEAHRLLSSRNPVEARKKYVNALEKCPLDEEKAKICTNICLCAVKEEKFQNCVDHASKAVGYCDIWAKGHAYLLYSSLSLKSKPEVIVRHLTKLFQTIPQAEYGRVSILNTSFLNIVMTASQYCRYYTHESVVKTLEIYEVVKFKKKIVVIDSFGRGHFRDLPEFTDKYLGMYHPSKDNTSVIMLEGSYDIRGLIDVVWDLDIIGIRPGTVILKNDPFRVDLTERNGQRTLPSARICLDLPGVLRKGEGKSRTKVTFRNLRFEISKSDADRNYLDVYGTEEQRAVFRRTIVGLCALAHVEFHCCSFHHEEGYGIMSVLSQEHERNHFLTGRNDEISDRRMSFHSCTFDKCLNGGGILILVKKAEFENCQFISCREGLRVQKSKELIMKNCTMKKSLICVCIDACKRVKMTGIDMIDCESGMIVEGLKNGDSLIIDKCKFVNSSLGEIPTKMKTSTKFVCCDQGIGANASNEGAKMVVKNCQFSNHDLGIVPGSGMEILNCKFENCRIGVNLCKSGKKKVRMIGNRFIKIEHPVRMSDQDVYPIMKDNVGTKNRITVYPMGGVERKVEKFGNKIMKKRIKQSRKREGLPADFGDQIWVVRCGGCGRVEEKGEIFKRCGACKQQHVRYCSKKCQKKDWSRHKRVCRASSVDSKKKQQVKKSE